MTNQQAGPTLRRLAHLSAGVVRAGVTTGLRQVLPSPPSIEAVPEGKMVDLPGRGRTFVVDVPGPSPSAPTIVLLHALSCTAYLSWVATLGELSRTYRIITFDQRWHGRGIRSPRFRFDDCADDVIAVMDEVGVDRAIVAGYSMGGAVAQLTWHRHRDRVAGLVLCSIARNMRGNLGERLFFPLMTAATHPLSSYALSQVERLAQSLPDFPTVEVADSTTFARVEFRSTSAWSLPEALSELGRFNSAPWIGDIDVPTAVVVTAKDRAIPARRQRRLAAAIDGVEVFDAPGGHASIFLDATRWVPVFLAAADDVAGRVTSEARATG